MLYHLPYHWSAMSIERRGDREFAYWSRRRFSSTPVVFQARYRGLGPTPSLAENLPGSLEYFLTERYCLFTRDRDGQIMRASIHHVSWQLEEAEADIARNDLAEAVGIHLPNTPPVLHYSRRLAIYVWQLERLRQAATTQRIPATAVPSG